MIVATVVATYWVLGAVYGNPTADDGRWTAVFLANFHFASVGTNYLDQTQPPSPLLNFWSLAVEEQFYLVYPALFVAIAALGAKATFRTRLVIGLVLIIVASFTLSVLQTSSDPTVAYFSPFTRAWELALGALVAAATPWLLRIPKVIGGVLTWLGLGAIAFSAVAFGATTAYPGSLAAIPVLGAGLVIAGGMAAPKWAAESVLGLQPFRWVGRISYSLYLWHWPILIIAADEAGKTSLPFRQNVVWLLLALGLSLASYRLVENPIRHLRISAKKSIALGVCAVLLTVAALSVAISAESEPLRSYTVAPVANAQTLYRQVAAATSITRVPTDMEPIPSQATNFLGRELRKPWVSGNGLSVEGEHMHARRSNCEATHGCLRGLPCPHVAARVHRYRPLRGVEARRSRQVCLSSRAGNRGERIGKWSSRRPQCGVHQMAHVGSPLDQHAQAKPVGDHSGKPVRDSSYGKRCARALHSWQLEIRPLRIVANLASTEDENGAIG